MKFYDKLPPPDSPINQRNKAANEHLKYFTENRKETFSIGFKFEPLKTHQMNQKITFLLLLCVALQSCGSKLYYQVCKTNSTTVQQKGEVLSHEDARCRIDYNLWAEHGDAGFVFFNKTDEVIYLLLDESFYVLNGVAYDYFQNRTFTDASSTVTSTGSGLGFAGYGRFGVVSAYSRSITSGKSSAVSITEAKVMAIPPGTSKRMSEFDISQAAYRDCDLLRYPSARKIKTKSFDVANSPLQFYNSITYRVGSGEKKTVKNDFYVSEITNYPDKEMFKTVSKEFCGEKDYNKMRVFKEMNADKFYIKYVKDQNGWKH